jgi:hypothetical protein
METDGHIQVRQPGPNALEEGIFHRWNLLIGEFKDRGPKAAGKVGPSQCDTDQGVSLTRNAEVLEHHARENRDCSVYSPRKPMPPMLGGPNLTAVAVF